MRAKLNVDEAIKVAGGNAYINANTMKITFDSFDDVYNLRNCTAAEAAAVCDSFIGQFSTVEEYDSACIQELQSREWI